jgi:cobalt-zinc-cadmium efflux system outer membrane protein
MSVAIRSRAIAAAWLLASVAFVPTDAVADDALHLETILADALAQNPEIRAALARATAAAAMPARASAWDDPTASFETWNAPSARIDRADNNIFRLSQRIPFPGKRALAGAIAARDADAARGEADAVALDVAAAVKRAYWDLWQAHETLGVYEREKALVQSIARIAEQKYGVGDVAQPDVVQAQVELTRVIHRLTTQALAIDAARAELNALVSRPPDTPLGTPADAPRTVPPATPADLAETALRSRPELVAQAAAVARDEDAVRLARRDRYPDFEVNVARFVNHDARDGYGGMVSVTIPLAHRAKYDAGVDEANARLASSQADLRRLQDRVRRDVEQAFVRARTALVQHDLFATTHVPQAEHALRVTEAAYEAGRIDFLRLLESARTIEMVHVEHVAAAADFERACAELERAVGTSVPRGEEVGR